MKDSPLIEFYVDEVVRKTDKAMLVKIVDEEYWLPLSQIQDAEVEEEGDYGTIQIPEWLAKRKGLI